MLAVFLIAIVLGIIIGAAVTRATFDGTSVFFGALVAVLGMVILLINWNAGFTVIYLGLGICLGPIASDLVG